MRDILCTLLNLFVWVIIARMLLSWFRLDPRSPMGQVDRALATVTEPVLAPVRRAMPMARIGDVGLDLSSLVVVLGIRLLVVPIVC